MPTCNISIEELISDIDGLARRVPDREPNVYTAQELADMWQCSRMLAQRRIRIGMDAGLIVLSRIAMADISGRKTTRPGYRLIVAKAKTKKHRK